METLRDINVVDVSHAGAMPFAAMILADNGAQVIKVESPSGDHFRFSLRGSIMASINRNKRGIAINLKKEEGKEILRKLVCKADVFLENFVPGAMEKLGFGYQDVSKLNPRIIYASISGFGQTGPQKNRPGYDVIAQAMSGIMMATGEKDRPPVRFGTSCIDFGAGMFAAIGVLLALRDREKTGIGQNIDVSLLETGLSWMNHFVTLYSISGELPQRIGSALPFLAPYQVFETSDGFVFIGVSTDSYWRSFCDLFSLTLLEKDPKYQTNDDRVANRDDLISILAPIIKKQSSITVLEKLQVAGIPHAPLLRVDEIIKNEQVIHRNIIHKMTHPEYGEIKIVKTPIFRNGKVADIRIPAPMLGQHTREVLIELGYNNEEITSMEINKDVIINKAPM
ncbi:MAG: CoA transferase [Pseudomonadota bacterium]